MFLKIRYSKNEVTPRSRLRHRHTDLDTLAETVHDASLLAPEMLSERKVDHFDSWAANFAESVTSRNSPRRIRYRMHTRFAKFITCLNCFAVFRTVADVQTADMLNSRAGTRERQAGDHASARQPGTEGVHPTLTERADRLKRNAWTRQWTTC